MPRRRLCALSLCLIAGQAVADCNPTFSHWGGQPGPTCGATVGSQVIYEAVARGRYISIESAPLNGAAGAAFGQIALDHPASALHTEITGRVWASDGPTIYGLNTNDPLNPILLGRVSLPLLDTFLPYVIALRVHGNFVYAIDYNRLYIIDVTNPATPIVRSITTIPNNAYMYDLDIVGGYAYLAVDEYPNRVHALAVYDIANPLQPIEMYRAPANGRQIYHLSHAPNLNGLYAISESELDMRTEIWSLGNPIVPTIGVVGPAVNSTAQGDYLNGLRAGNAATCMLVKSTNKLYIYNPNTLALIGQPIQINPSNDLNGLGYDPPYAFVTRNSGELARVNVTTGTLVDNSVDSFPGYASKIAFGNGFTAIGGSGDWYLFSSPSGGTPVPITHLKPDAGFAFSNLISCRASGNMFVVEQQLGGNVSRVLGYHVSISPSVGVTYLGNYTSSDQIVGLDAGVDGNGTLRVYYTTWVPASVSALHVLDATSLASMTHTAQFNLTTGVSAPIHFSAAIAGSAPSRVFVGGNYSKTQIVNVDPAGSMSSLGVIPFSSVAIAEGNWPTMWFLDYHMLRAFDVTSPATATLQSATRVAWPYYALDFQYNFQTGISGVTTDEGNLVRIDCLNPAAPNILQYVPISSPVYYGYPNSIAFRGNALQVANGADGFTVVPLTGLEAPPHENTNASLDINSTMGILPLCTGPAFSLAAHFVAVPAIDTYTWLRQNRVTNQFEAMTDGPTGSGSTISGAATATLTITNPGGADATFYKCRAANVCGTAETAIVDARMGGYANCDRSTIAPVLNVNDFICFLNQFASEGPSVGGYANCDGSTGFPVLNVNDFVCFLNQFAAGCT